MTGRTKGLLALSPLLVFLAVYLVSSFIARDFYKVPIASAFLIASGYALVITPAGSINERIAVFSRGAGHSNVLLMIWIFVMAGAFASTAKAIGSIDATVNITLQLLPGRFILMGLFVASCFISMAIGTSVGTVVALVPIASGLADGMGAPLALVLGAIVGGAFFGDNLSFISDTTIAATKSQGCSMSDKFRTNIWIAAPAAVAVAVLYLFLGSGYDATPDAGGVNFVLLIPYISVIVLAICGMNVLGVLSIGLLLNAVIGFCNGSFGWIDFLGSVGEGIGNMGELIIVTMLAGGMLEIIRHNGGIDFIINALTRRIKGRRGAEFSIAALVAFANVCTANNTIAIITTGSIAKDISTHFGVDPRKSASILDTFSCIIQGILPYGAQLLMASGLAGISAIPIITHLYYPLALLVVAVMAIVFGFPRQRSLVR
ncbi:MAG: Na+/H+ antiporter NhaC family protein [Bacteroidales bacterium]|nr:Na+/H+ antiporter NhaC family protein [Bacteroidales bacterium]